MHQGINRIAFLRPTGWTQEYYLHKVHMSPLCCMFNQNKSIPSFSEAEYPAGLSISLLPKMLSGTSNSLPGNSSLHEFIAMFHFKKILNFWRREHLTCMPIIGWKWIDRGRTSRHPRIDLQRRSQSGRCAAVTSLLTEQYGAKNPVSRNLGRIKLQEENEIPTSVS